HIFLTTSDTEVILHMLVNKKHAETPDPLASVLRNLRGSYCLLILYPDRIEAVRDPSGNRPLCLGKVGDSWIVASETCAIDKVTDAEYVREVEPGEIVTLSMTGMSSESKRATWMPASRSRSSPLPRTSSFGSSTPIYTFAMRRSMIRSTHGIFGSLRDVQGSSVVKSVAPAAV
ncbi:MAG: hypothetical protein IIB36_20280, partial [Gemmatimonadetes bacterium]|nr:hypothetical protein [Gemmatimonadota bacterium]